MNTRRPCQANTVLAIGRQQIMAVRTKSIYGPVEQSDGQRFLVTRFWPRGLSKARLALTAWLRSLAPSRELLKRWKAGEISWPEYEIRYREEMSGQQEEINRLASKAARGTMTLLCFEREGDPHCHRHILKRMIEARLDLPS